MFKRYYEFLKIKERDLSKAAIRRLKGFVILSAPAFPILTAIEVFNTSDRVNAILIPIGLVSMVFLCILSFNRVVNTLSRTNKNLDEWEIRRKTAAESFALRCWFLVLGLFWLAVTVLDTVAHSNVLPALRIEHLFWIMGNFIVGTLIFIGAHVAWTIEPLETADEMGAI